VILPGRANGKIMKVEPVKHFEGLPVAS